MAGRKSLLTPELIETVSNAIKSGAWDYIACEAAGISQSTFYQWLDDAAKDDADPLKVEFLESISLARAEARKIAEARVFEDNPTTWLLRGPGREKPGREGWAAESKVTVSADEKTKIALGWENADEDETD